MVDYILCKTVFCTKTFDFFCGAVLLFRKTLGLNKIMKKNNDKGLFKYYQVIYVVPLGNKNT